MPTYSSNCYVKFPAVCLAIRFKDPDFVLGRGRHDISLTNFVNEMKENCKTCGMTTPPPKGLNHPPDPALGWIGCLNGQAA